MKALVKIEVSQRIYNRLFSMLEPKIASLVKSKGVPIVTTDNKDIVYCYDDGTRAVNHIHY